MTCAQFPSTGLVPNQTTHTVGNVKYVWTGVVWESVTNGLTADQIDWDKSGGNPITQSRESLRRTYADAGYKLIDAPASFDEGGVLSNEKEVLLDLTTNKAYAWTGTFPKTVSGGTRPDAQWKDVSNSMYVPELDLGANAAFVGAILKAGGVEPDGSGDTDENSQVFEALRKIFPDAKRKTIKDLAKEGNDGERVFIDSFHTSHNTGGGWFVWSSQVDRSKHNGGTIISPSVTFPASWNDAGKTAWFATLVQGGGKGCWVRCDNTGPLEAEWFGAVPWPIGNTEIDSTLEFRKVASMAGAGGTWKWRGRHRITNSVEIPTQQTFGSYGAGSLLPFSTSNYQGPNDPTITFDHERINAVFFDSDAGEAFRCNEGASPENFLIYGNGIIPLGGNIGEDIPTSFRSISAFKHRKYIRPTNVSVALFTWAYDSSSWYSSDPGQGDYHTIIRGGDVTYCKYLRRTSLVTTFNTKFENVRCYVCALGDHGVASRNFVFLGGSIEGMKLPTQIRGNSNFSFIGTYFETFSALAAGETRTMFNIIGGCLLNFQNCLIYLNNISHFVYTGDPVQGAGVSYINITSSGNEFRLMKDGQTSQIYAVSTVVRNNALAAGDLTIKSAGATVSYWPGAAPSGIYSAPMAL